MWNTHSSFLCKCSYFENLARPKHANTIRETSKKDNSCYIVDSLSFNVNYLIYKTISMVLAEKSTERKAKPDTNCRECTVDSLVFTNGPVAEKKRP